MAEAEILAKESAKEGAGSALPALPPDALIIVPVRNTVLFPGLVLPITIGRPKSIAAAQQAVREQRQVGILLQRDAEVADPAAIDMHRIGTVANILRYVTAPDGTHHLICQGEQRFRIGEYLSGWPFLVARVRAHPRAHDAYRRDRGPVRRPGRRPSRRCNCCRRCRPSSLASCRRSSRRRRWPISPSPTWT